MADQRIYLLGSLVGLGLAILLGACTAPPDDNESGCDCPNFESIASGIDWLGDGSTADVTAVELGSGDTPLTLGLRYNVTDRLVALRSAKERVRGLGLAIVEDDVEFVVLAGDGWELGISAGNEQLFVKVFMANDDESAAAILQPLVDAFGLIP